MINNEILEILEDHHGIFYNFFSFGKLTFSDSIDTACIVFDKYGRELDFLFNPNYWNKMDNYQRAFVIAHEILHILYQHGQRGKGHIPSIANVAMDVVVNETLVSGYGFDRDKLYNSEQLCWMNTVFKNKPNTLSNRNYEYYYNELMQDVDKLSSFFIIDSDGHSTDTAIPSEFIKDILKGLSPQELSQFKEDKEHKPGTEKGNTKVIIEKLLVVKKKRWDKLIKEFCEKALEDSIQERWNPRNRRFATLDENLFIPSEYEDDNEIDSKVTVYFYLDTSGSCEGYARRFMQAARSLDLSKFNVKLFCFDTKVYETSLESGELYGFGGTAFNIIENSILEQSKKLHIEYPKLVFVITDGYGTPVSPKKPRNWHWFLTEHSSISCIPKECNIHHLKDFE